MATQSIRSLNLGLLLALGISCHPHGGLDTPAAPWEAGDVPVLAALVEIGLTEDLLQTDDGQDCLWTWNLQLEVLEPESLSGTEIVVNFDEHLPTVGERDVAIGDRMRFVVPADWQRRDLWRGELDGFESPRSVRGDSTGLAAGLTSRPRSAVQERRDRAREKAAASQPAYATRKPP